MLEVGQKVKLIGGKRIRTITRIVTTREGSMYLVCNDDGDGLYWQEDRLIPVTDEKEEAST